MEKLDSKIPSKSHLSQKSQYHICDIVTIVKDVMVVTKSHICVTITNARDDIVVTKSHICVTVTIVRDVIVVTKVTFVSLSQMLEMSWLSQKSHLCHCHNC